MNALKALLLTQQINIFANQCVPRDVPVIDVLLLAVASAMTGTSGTTIRAAVIQSVPIVNLVAALHQTYANVATVTFGITVPQNVNHSALLPALTENARVLKPVHVIEDSLTI